MVLRVLLVRHAQSENNIVQANVQHKIKAGVSPQDAQAEWLSKRHDDPDLSPEGFDQLTYLQKFASTVPAKTGCRTFQVFTSPMQRACSTTKPVCDALQAPGVVMPDLVEVGGLYHAYQDPNGYWQKGVSSTAGSAQDLWNRFQFDVSQLPQQGPWDGGRGNESTELALMRAQRVADWLMKLAVIKSASLDSNQVPDCVVLVSHADFLALLLAALNKIDAQGANDNPDFDVSVHGVPDVLTAGSGDLSVHGATERGLSMTLAGDGSSHSGSSHSSTPYRLRKGPSPGLGSEVAAPQQVVLQSDIDEAPNVYKRYRISLACTSLLQIKPEGKVKTVWMNKKDHLEVQGGCAACILS